MEEGYRAVDVDDSLIHGILRISRSIRAVLSLKLADIGLSVGDDDVLLALSSLQVTSTVLLARSMSISGATLQRIVGRLVSKGCVEKVSGTLIRLTGKGEDMRKAVVAIHRDLEEQVVDHADPRKLDDILDHLRFVNTKIRRSLTDLDHP
jgi:DNA-binding MarR family transcriptional regulator